MTQEEYTNIITDIRKAEDMALIADKLGLLSTEHDKEIAELENIRQQLENKNAENESLRETNMKLLQQITIPEQNFNQNQDTNKDTIRSESEIYESLFDENGNFK